MVEIVDHHGRFAMLAADTVVVAHVGKTLLGAEMAHVGIEFAPVGAVLAVVNVAVEAV